MPKNKRRKIIIAGPLRFETITPVVVRSDGPLARQAKKRLTSQAQARVNQRNCCLKLEMLLACNFRRGDLFVTLTYDDAHLPTCRKAAMYEAKRFVDRLRAIRKKTGRQLVTVWVTEHKHGEGRWHHHLVLNATTGQDYEDILKAWGDRGSVKEFIKLEFTKEKTYAALARYLTKEARDKVGDKAWSCTRNVQRPTVESYRVDDEETLQVPRGAWLLEQEDHRTVYGVYQYVKYLLPGDLPPAVRRKRRRR